VLSPQFLLSECDQTQASLLLLPSYSPVLTGSAVGSCLVSEDNSWNLGVVQISPQAAANGSLSILYVNGDKCGNQRYSTRITFECAQTAVCVCSAVSSVFLASL
jgi:hypothetical protein